MSNSSVQGTLHLIGCYLVDGDPVQAKAQEIPKITHFVDSVEEPPRVVIVVTENYRLYTVNGNSLPTAIGTPTNKGTVYSYSQNGFYIEVRLKKMVGTVSYVKESAK